MTRCGNHNQTTELSDADLEKVTGGDGRAKPTGQPTTSDIPFSKLVDVASSNLYR